MRAAGEAGAVYFEQTNIYAGMDPRLQRVVDRRQRGMRTLATASSGAEEIGVIAPVSDPQAWRERSDWTCSPPKTAPE